MTQSRYEQGKQKVSLVFAHPNDIKDATDLTHEQKLELLNQWDQDLRELITASGEGMIALHPGNASESLVEAEKAIRQL
jgi:hypothetical protein